MEANAFYQAMADGAIILTPNQRLTRFFHDAYASRQVSEAKTIWPTPTIVPLHTWLAQCYDQCCASSTTPLPRRLRPLQAQQLWYQIFQLAQQEQPLLAITATVQQAQQAWQLCHAWRISFDHPAFESTDDSACFRAWANQFRDLCEKYHVRDNDCLATELVNLDYQQSAPLILAGFSEITPQLQTLLNNFSVSINHYHATHATSQAGRVTCTDREQEIAQMLAWAQQQVQLGKQRVACVIPDLAALRETVRQHAWQHFQDARLYNISAGIPLADYPVINSALAVCAIAANTSMQQWQLLLRSPFIAGTPQELLERAELDVALREYATTQLRITQIIECTQTLDLAPDLQHRLRQLQAQQQPQQQPLYAWAQHFATRLELVGWPGDRLLDSHEYQAVQRMQDVLQELQNLDITQTPLTLYSAVQLLQRLCQQTIFQPQSQQEPIQLLGLLEAAGMTFDALWIMGMDDTAWPPAAQPNPFIPLQLQKQFSIPRATAQREYQFSLQLTQQFITAAPEVIISFAMHDRDGSYQISPLFADLPEVICSNTIPADPWQILQQHSQLETWQDDSGSAVSATNLTGGSYLLQEQAACPFRAFARFRLRAESLAIPHLGFDSLERGLLAHYALENFWRDTQTQQQLLQYGATVLRQHITRAVHRALQTLTQARHGNVTPGLLALEQQRLETLLWQWLQLEMQRPGFTVIAIEQALTVTLAGMTLRLRIDRIDTTDEGDKLIIDYKTGLTDLYDCFGERMAQPQLPLYAISQPEIAGLAFAQLRSDAMRWQGISRDDVAIPGIKPLAELRLDPSPASWTTQLEIWRQDLSQLITEAASGYAAVKPRHASECRYCEFPSFCRI